MSKQRRQNADRPTAAVIYCRVSTDAQADGTSLATQEAACREYADRKGWAVVEAVHDTASRATLDRAGLDRLRELLRDGIANKVLAYVSDRLSGKLAHIFVLLHEVENAGADIEFVTEHFENNAIGRFVLGARVFGAEVEREMIMERTLRGKRAALQSGRLLAMGGPLYGYRSDREHGKRVIYEPEAAVVRDVCRWLTEEGLSVRACAGRLNAEGVPTPGNSGPRGRKPTVGLWAVSTITRILRREELKGESWAWRFQRQQGVNDRQRPRDEQIAMPDGTTPAIITPELWDVVQHRLDTNRSAYHRNLLNPRLLRGMVRCAACGNRMQPNRARGRAYYQCKQANTPARVPCGSKVVPADALEAWVKDEVAAVLRNPALIAAELAREDDPTEADAERLRLRRALADLDRRIGNTVTAMADADTPALRDDLNRQYKSLDAERQTRRTALAGLDATAQRRRDAHRDLGNLYDYCERVAARIERWQFDDWRAAFLTLNVTVTATGKAGWWLLGEIPGEPVGVVVPDSSDGRHSANPFTFRRSNTIGELKQGSIA